MGKIPIVADATKIFQNAGFRISRQNYMENRWLLNGAKWCLLQNPYPMYFYPDNLLESILIFQKGNLSIVHFKETREDSRYVKEFSNNKWYMT